VEKGSNALKEETLDLVAERFRLLGDPLRLRLLQTLAEGEHSVAELVDMSSTTQANISKHLQLLLRAGLVKRRKQGLHSYYSIADPSVFQLCDLVCGSIGTHLNVQLAALPSTTHQGGTTGKTAG
jgi:DNA-binding transcriptional ArsR family regulator